MPRLVELMSVNPARILRVPGGSLTAGAVGRHHDRSRRICGVSVEAAKLRSRSKNTPFDGWQLRGGVAATIVGGRTVYVNEAAPITNL